MAISDQAAIVLSGPLSRRAQVLKSLTGNGFAKADEDNPMGLPSTAEGDDDPSIGFVSVHGDDVDRALELVQGTGWVLRAHWQAVMRTSPPLAEDDRLAAF